MVRRRLKGSQTVYQRRKSKFVLRASRITLGIQNQRMMNGNIRHGAQQNCLMVTRVSYDECGKRNGIPRVPRVLKYSLRLAQKAQIAAI